MINIFILINVSYSNSAVFRKSFAWECRSILRHCFEDDDKLFRCSFVDRMITANVEYTFFISSFIRLVFFSSFSFETMSRDAARFAKFFDFLTRFSSIILLTFNLADSISLLRSIVLLIDSTMFKNVWSISDRSFEIVEKLSFIVRLSRDVEKDKFVDATWNEIVISEVEKDCFKIEIVKTSFAIDATNIFDADEFSTNVRLRIEVVNHFSSFSVKSTM